MKTFPGRPWQEPRWLRWLRAYMGYSRTEAQGMILLLGIALGFLFVPMALRPDLPVYLSKQDAQEADRLVAGLKEHQLADKGSFASRYPKRKFEPRESKYPKVPQVALSAFDPNALEVQDWEARGVPHFVATRIVKYREAAGGFRSKAQIKKMYGLDPPVYERLAPFMQLPEEAPKRERHDYAAKDGADGKFPPFASGSASSGKYPRKPRNLQPFDLNEADTTQLMQIRGIGKGRAWGIVKERNLLGGFVDENQLDGVWVFRESPDLLDSVKKYTFIAPGFQPKLVNINTALFEEMCFHPCIRKPLARAIVAWRGQHGGFKQVDELKQIPWLKAADLEKLRPYVRCE